MTRFCPAEIQGASNVRDRASVEATRPGQGTFAERHAIRPIYLSHLKESRRIRFSPALIRILPGGLLLSCDGELSFSRKFSKFQHEHNCPTQNGRFTPIFHQRHAWGRTVPTPQAGKCCTARSALHDAHLL